MRRGRVDAVLLGVALASVVALLAWRIAEHGVLSIAPDDASYVGVGRQLLSFDAPRTISGNLFTIRSWVWPLLLGGASRITPDDAFRGPMVLGVVFGGIGLTASVVFAYFRRGGLAAIATALALGMSAVVWEIAGSVHVDVALVAFLVVTLCVAAEPTGRRVLAAGALAALTLLIKESSGLLVFLPLAWIGSKPFPAWRRDAIRFWVVFALVVSWWFVIVLVARGEVFPLQGYAQAVRRQVPRGWGLNVAAWTLVGSWGVAAALLAVRARRDVGVRVLLLAMVAIVPPTYIAWKQEFAIRQFAPLAVLGAIAIGVAIGDLGRPLVARARRPALVIGGVAVALTAIALVPIFRIVETTQVGTAPPIDRDIARWLDTKTPNGTPVVTTFRFQALLWVRQSGHNDFRGLGVRREAEVSDVAGQVWLGWEAGNFGTLARSRVARLSAGDIVILTGAHPLGPAAFAAWLDVNGPDVGLTHVARFGELGSNIWAVLYRVTRPEANQMPTLLTLAALDHLDDSIVRDLGPVVVAGPEPEVVTGVARVESLGGGPATAFVAPER